MKTTAELRISGTYREDRHGNRADGILPDGIPEAPAHLNDDEAAIFQEIAKKMHENSTLSTLDVYTLEQYSVQLALFRKAKKELEVSKEYVVEHTNKNGNTNSVPGPWITILKNTSSDMLKLSAKLGLSPVDRNKASKAEKPVGDNSLFKDPTRLLK